MDLLLQINLDEEAQDQLMSYDTTPFRLSYNSLGCVQATLVMVTHNPDVECYADRILYVQDGRIVEQAVNSEQNRLDFEDYLAYLESQHK